jgi:hypothetical protein
MEPWYRQYHSSRLLTLAQAIWSQQRVAPSPLAEAAAKLGASELLEWWHIKVPQYSWSKEMAIAVAEDNFLLLQWLWERVPTRLRSDIVIERLQEQVARKGNLVILQWLHMIMGRLTSRVCREAVLGGNREVLEWLNSIPCPCGSHILD